MQRNHITNTEPLREAACRLALGSEVKIVVSTSVSRADKCIRIEKWCLAQAGSAPRPNTRACPNGNTPLPRMVQEITITPNITVAAEGTTAQSGEGASAGSYTVTGAPLILPFEDMFLRPPVQQEHDIVLTAAGLLKYATGLWLGM
ncbi:hypothetical protein VTN00DRAFT_4749 [Thermoascus crustaceus]|uniref:uncharacterized protein n=1 Tax=Thermoascus crustaceus TaxID=5088 RepID=UPI003743F611